MATSTIRINNIIGVNGYSRCESFPRKSSYLSFEKKKHHCSYDYLNLNLSLSPCMPTERSSKTTCFCNKSSSPSISSEEKTIKAIIEKFVKSQDQERFWVHTYLNAVNDDRLFHYLIAVGMKDPDGLIIEKLRKCQEIYSHSLHDLKNLFRYVFDSNFRIQTCKKRVNETIDTLLEHEGSWGFHKTMVDRCYDVIDHETLKPYFQMSRLIKKSKSGRVHDGLVVLLKVSAPNKIVDDNIHTREDFKDFLNQLRAANIAPVWCNPMSFPCPVKELQEIAAVIVT